MTGEAGGIEDEARGGIGRREVEEGVVKVVVIQQRHVVVDDIGDIHPDLVEAEPLGTAGPGVSTEEVVEHLGGGPETRELLAQDDDDVWTKSFRLCRGTSAVRPAARGDLGITRDELQLEQALRGGSLVS